MRKRRRLAPNFRPVFERQEAGYVRFAVTTITLAEVFAGPLVADEALAERYGATLKSWFIVDLDAGITESGCTPARLSQIEPRRRRSGRNALAIIAGALVSHDRDFSRLISFQGIGTMAPGDQSRIEQRGTPRATIKSGV